MASSVSAPVVVAQATKRTHSEMSNSDVTSPQNPPNPAVQSSLPAESTNNTAPVTELKPTEPTIPTETKILNVSETDSGLGNEIANTPVESAPKENGTKPSVAAVVDHHQEPVSQQQPTPAGDAKPTDTSSAPASKPVTETNSVIPETKISSDGASAEKASDSDTSKKVDTEKAADGTPHIPTSSALAPSSQPVPQSNSANVAGPVKSTPEPMETSVATGNQETAKPIMETAASQPKPVTTTTTSTDAAARPSSSSNSKPVLEDGEEPEKKAKIAPSTSSTSKGAGKTPEQILEYMDKTFDQRRKTITKQMPTIPELKVLYPDLFMGKQLLIEFQRITKIDIDQKIQEFCVRYATAVIEMARNKKGAAPVLARWEQAKQENDTLKQYWDMVTALCLLPLHFGENFVEMVLEIGEDEEVVPQGKIVPTLVARGNIFRTDEFFLIAENTIVQEFEEFTIAFASLYSSYWVFNMVYPETIENTYNYIQRCIVRQREPGSIPTVCKNFTKALQKWNKGKENK